MTTDGTAVTIGLGTFEIPHPLNRLRFQTPKVFANCTPEKSETSPPPSFDYREIIDIHATSRNSQYLFAANTAKISDTLTRAMAFNFKNLDQATRNLMLNEVTHDFSKEGGLYLSRRFSNEGRQVYETLLRNAIANGNEETLAASLNNPAYFNETEQRNVKGKTVIAKIPSNAAELVAQGEFNRFYIRALCLRAVNENKTLQIYRAKHSNNPRPESEAMIGQTVNSSQTLLKDLRDNYEVDKILGLPPGPNSGLTCELI